MNKKGFTLAELLGVIIIIALLSLIIIPKIIGTFVEISEQIDDSTKLVITEASKDYYSENQNYIAKMDYCISVLELQNQGLLSYDLKDSNGELIPNTTIVKIYKNGANYKVNEKCNITDNDVINAAKAYYNDGKITISNGTSKCITLANLQNDFYITKNASKNDVDYSGTTSIRLTNNGTLTVEIGASC